MTTRISIRLSDIDKEFIDQLKKKYSGDVRLNIEVVQSEVDNLFSEEDFWNVIHLLDWSQNEENNDKVLAPAIEYLSQLAPALIFRFQDILAEKLFQLDKQIYAENIGEDSYHPEKPFSADHFLYARACVVANGKAYFEKVLDDPTQMPKDLTFEPLLNLAGKAYQKKTGQDFDYFPTMVYETFSNPEGWK
jgi:hypothetical protein